MTIQTASFARLALLVQRLQDADMLLDSETSTLLAEVEAARLAREQGDSAAGEQHLEAVAGFVEALVQSQALTGKDGRAVIETARGLK